MRSERPPFPPGCTEPRPMRLRCLPACKRCRGAGEWFVGVPWAVVDIDSDAIPATHGACWWVRTLRGWHLHFPSLPASATPGLARSLGGDPGHAAACAARGWSTERPVPTPERWGILDDCDPWAPPDATMFELTLRAHAAAGRLVLLTGGTIFLDRGWRRTV